MMDAKKALVFAAHADDEIIGPGGTLRRLASAGCEILVVTFTRGETAYSSAEEKKTIAETRAEEGMEAAKILGVAKTVNLGLPCQGVVNTTELYQKCVGIIRSFQPHVIFSHSAGDKHRDHRAVSALTEEAWWKAQENVLADLGKPWRATGFFFYEIFELFTRPSLVVDITDVFAKKLEALRSQRSQLKVLPGIMEHCEGLAKVRGAAAGVSLGEAFLESAFMPRIA